MSAFPAWFLYNYHLNAYLDFWISVEEEVKRDRREGNTQLFDLFIYGKKLKASEFIPKLNSAYWDKVLYTLMALEGRWA